MIMFIIVNDEFPRNLDINFAENDNFNDVILFVTPNNAEYTISIIIIIIVAIHYLNILIFFT